MKRLLVSVSLLLLSNTSFGSNISRVCHNSDGTITIPNLVSVQVAVMRPGASTFQKAGLFLGEFDLVESQSVELDYQRQVSCDEEGVSEYSNTKTVTAMKITISPKEGKKFPVGTMNVNDENKIETHVICETKTSSVRPCQLSLF